MTAAPAAKARLVLRHGLIDGSVDGPDYVPEIGQAIWDPSSTFSPCHLYAFVVPGDVDRLRAFCHLSLDSVDGGWEPDGCHVLVAFESFRLKGVDQHCAAVWFPVLRGDPNNPERAWAMPYLIVDSPWWLCTGRETFGLPAQLGVFRWQPESGRLAVETQTVKRFGAGQQAEYCEVLKVEWHRGRLKEVSGNVPEAGVNDSGYLRHRLATARGAGGARFVVLKQHRDVAQPHLACYRRILRIDRVAPTNEGAPDLAADGTDAATPSPSAPVSEATVTFAKVDGEAFERVLGCDRSAATVDAFKVAWPHRLQVAAEDNALRGSVGYGRSYAERGGEIVYRQPSSATDARMFAFLVGCDRKKVDKFCERTFNRPAGGGERWRAYSGEVFLTVVDIGQLSSGDRMDEPLGSVSEKEFAVWVPVQEQATRRVAWAVPYMLVDNQLALCGGREGFGFPKRFGEIRIDSRPDGSDAYRHPVAFEIYEGTLACGQSELVASFRCAGTPPDLLRRRWRGEADRLSHEFTMRLGGHGGGLLSTLIGSMKFLENAGVRVAEHLARGHVPFLLLDQFPEAAEPTRACYQAVVEVDNALTHLHQGGFLDGTWVVDFGHRLGTLLEHEIGIRRAQQPDLGFWLDFDFTCTFKDVLFHWQEG